MGNSLNDFAMFTFSTSLWFNKRAISPDQLVTLYLRVYIGNSGYRATKDFNLRLRWPVDKINLEGHTVLSRFVLDPDVNDYNLIILSERAKHNEIAKLFRLSDTNLDIEVFCEQLNLFDHRKALVSFMKKKRKLLLTKKHIGYSTYMNIGSCINSLVEYQVNVRFDQINEKWMDDYRSWLQHTKELKPATVWGRIKDLKHYLRMANEEKLINVNQKAIDFKNPKPLTETVYLNREELRRLIVLPQNCYLSEVQTNVLRAFLFTCFTSLRISDVYKAGNQMLVTENSLTFVMTKNSRTRPKKISIPLIPIARELVNDSLKSFFNLPTHQAYNRTLKVLAEMAKINKNITSHVGRHTFGYMYMTTVGNIYGLMKIMGHTKVETTERYAHLDEDYQLQQAMKLQGSFEGLEMKF